MLTAYLVTSLADTVAADGAITLREAIQAANTNVAVNEAPAGSSIDTDSIQFDPSLTGGTITLLGGNQLSISQKLDIHGLGPDRLTINANNASRIFNITGASTAVTIDNMRLTSGNASQGGAVQTAGRLTLSEAIIENCQSSSYAAAIYNTGQLSLRSVTLRSNTTTGSYGGTVYDGSGSTLLVINSVVYGNLGVMGRGLAHEGAGLTVINSTISGNTTTSNGGGIWVNAGMATIVQSTITGNAAAQGGGVYVQSGATAVVKNTVIAGNTSTSTGRDVNGTFDAASDYNVIGVVDGSTGLSGAHIRSGTAAAPLDAMLGPLADNGGLSRTHKPWDGSPVLNSGNNNFALDETGVPLVSDQRGAGFDRILAGTVDIGAVEGSRAVQFALTDPVGARVIGQTINVVWDPTAVPANSQISLYYDTDATLNGNEVWFMLNAPAPANGVVPWTPLALPPGTYYVGGTLTAPDGTGYTSRLSAMSLTAGGTTYAVNSLADVVAADGLVTLREAVLAANTNSPVGDAPAGSAASSDLITFDPALFGSPPSKTIVLTGTQMGIADHLLIVGPGRDLLTVNADNKSRVFSITDPALRVGITGLTLSNGKTTTDGGAIYNAASLELAGLRVTNSTAYDDGGAVFNSGSLTVSDSKIDENSSNGSADPSGGGLWSEGPSLKLRNVEFTLNVAYADGGGLAVSAGNVDARGLTFSMNTAFKRAGGMLVASGTVQVTGATFSQNTSYTNGGGAHFAAGTVTLTDAVFDRNSVVSGGGGGLRNDSSGAVTLVHCTLTSNSATTGGGLYDEGSGTLTMRNTQISSNSATNTGGGMYDRYGTTRIDSNSQITSNSAAGGGGGIDMRENTMSIFDSRIDDNRVSGSGVSGGGIQGYATTLSVSRSSLSRNQVQATGTAYGGAIYIYNYNGGSSPSLTDSTIADNRLSGLDAGYGGGVSIMYGSGSLTRSTVSGNVCYGGATSQGGGVYGSWTVVNSTVSGNRAYGAASASGGGLYVTPGSVTQSTIAQNDAAVGGGMYASGAVRVRNTIVAGNTAEFSAPDVYGAYATDSGANLIGIIDGSTSLDLAADTLFGSSAAPLSAGLAALANNGGYTRTHALLTGSPALDAGNNTYAAGLSTDQTGRPRIAGARVDIGAYEGTLVPAFGFSGPTGTISGGQWQAFTWNAATVSADARLTIYADPDGLLNGNEVLLLSSGDPNVLAGRWDWPAVDLPAGTYTLGATLTDRVTGGVTNVRLAGPTTLVYDQAYVVDSLADTVAVDGTVTLREAILAANANQPVGDAHAGRAGAVDVILFAPALSGARITLSQGELAVSGDLSIQGLGPAALEISANHATRVFRVAGGVKAWISNLTLLDGSTSGAGGDANDDGGAILNDGNLFLHDAVVRANVAYDDGGGVMNRGTLAVANCTFTANVAQGSSSNSGGAIAIGAGAKSTVIETSLLLQNTAKTGGGIFNTAGDLTLRSTVVRKNTATVDGGGVWTEKYLAVLQNVTLANNLCFNYGGGLSVISGPARFYNSTASSNSATYGGGIYDNSNATLTLRDSQVNSNSASSKGGALYDYYGTTTISNTELTGNSSVDYGGGVMMYSSTTSIFDSRINDNRLSGSTVYGGGMYCEYNFTLSIYRSELSRNLAQGSSGAYGGALAFRSSYLASVALVDCTIADNRASGLSGGQGGGVYGYGNSNYNVNAYLTRCTVSGNVLYGASTSQGGGVYSGYYGTTYVIDSTLSGNRAYGAASASGGGLYVSVGGSAYVTQCTITLNSAAIGGGIYRDQTPTRVRNTIVAGNTAEFSAPDVFGTFATDSGANLIGIIDGSTNLDTADTIFGTALAPKPAGLAALANNGGYTLTHALLAGSPAIDAGNNAYALDGSNNPITTDQRGRPRILAGRVEIGAYEGSVTEGFHLSGPSGPIEAGTRVQITWTGGTIGANTLLSIYADPDALINGNEIYLLKDADPNPLAGAFTWYTVDVPAGTYTLGASVIDRITALALTDRMAATVTISYANAYVVNSTADTVAADGVLTLREAIQAANTNTAVGDARAGRSDGVDVVLFAPTLAGATITVTSAIPVLDGLSIQRPGDAPLTLASNGTDRLFDIVSGVNAWMSSLSLINGFTTGDGGALRNQGNLRVRGLAFTGNRSYDDGGAVANFGTLTGSGLTFTNNRATGGSTEPDGGALYNEGLVRLDAADFTGNTATKGGAVYVLGGADTYLTGAAPGRSTMAQNTASAQGGAIYSAGYFVLSAYNFSGSTAATYGGAMCFTAGSATLRDFSATGGTAARGGAIYNSSGGSLFLQNAQITSNRASTYGGGICDEAGGTLTIRDSQISSNTASTQGGGLYDPSGTTTIQNTQITGNFGGTYGGGISGGSAMSILDSRITDNRLSGTNVYGAGLYGTSPSVYRSEISRNQAQGSSGAYGGGVYVGSATFLDCTIADNQISGLNAGQGAGAYLYYTNYLTRCTVSGNVVYGAVTSQGGGVYGAGSYCSLYLTNSTVSGNRAYGAAAASGGGLNLGGSAGYSHYITQSTVTLNDAAIGGGIYRDQGDVRVRNSVLAGNTASSSGPDASGVFLAASGANLIGIIDGSTNLDAAPDTIFGTAAVPKLAKLGALADNGGYTLTHALLAGSPAVNVGRNTYAVDPSSGNALTTDQRGGLHLRIIDGTVDIGAYEGAADTYFALTAPSGGNVPAAWDTPIRWTGNVPTSSLISLYVDTDGTLNGNETYLFRNQPYPGLGGQYLWQSVASADGMYQIGAVVTDPVGGGYWAGRTPQFHLVHSGVPTLYIVNTTSDVVAADGVISLREALQAANTNAAVGDAPAGDPVEMDVIRFDPALAGRTITLGSPLVVTNHVAIEGTGEGAFRTILDAHATGRVFDVAAGTTVRLSRMRLTGGTAGTGSGGAITNAGDLSLTDMEVFSNTAAHGGGVANSATTSVLDLTRVWVHDNRATDASGRGGGVLNEWGRVEALDSTISANTARYGGGLNGSWAGDLLVTNSTVSGNTASGSSAIGGGIYIAQSSNARLVNATVKGNTASGSSSAAGGIGQDGGNFFLVNTIVAGNAAPTQPDVRGTFDPASDYNLIGAIDGSTGLNAAHALTGTVATPLDAKLAALADNGGPTPTHAVQTGSPAINAGSSDAAVDFAGAPLAFDQRGTGYGRIQNGQVDLGAFEYSASPGDNQPPAIGALVLSADPVVSGDSITLTATGVTDDHGVAAVAFYADTNRDGTPDVLLGTDLDPAGGWSWTGSVTWALGQARYLAQATDDGWPSGAKTSAFAAASGTVIAASPPSITLGSYDLIAGDTQQRIQIRVTGLDQVTGMNLYAQIGDGPGGTAEPVFTSVDFGGTIWGARPNTIVGGPTPGATQRIQASVVFNNPGDQTQADGLLATLVVDTRGFLAGQEFPLLLRLDPGGPQSQFVLYGGHTRAPTVVDGRIRIFEATVVGRYVFYNESAFDGNAPAINTADNAAIATNKTALLRGGTATFANYTSYLKGINGVMVDLRGAHPENLTVDSFRFRMGNTSTPSSWPDAPRPNGFDIRTGGGTGGSDRVTFTWANETLRNTWLQVTVLGAAAGLAADDVFYFGNAIGETGNSAGDTFVNATDYVAVRDHFTHAPAWAGITSAFDMDRDNLVNGSDMAAVRDNSNDFLTALRLITVPAATPAPSGAPAIPPAGAGGSPQVIVGTRWLVAGEPNQVVPILVTGGAGAAGFNLYAQLGDGSQGQPEPVFTGTDFSDGMWDAAGTATGGGPVAGFPQYAQAWVALQEENAEVATSGKIVNLVVDTTGFLPGQQFDLKLAASDIGANSCFVGAGGEELPMAIVNGQIQLVAALNGDIEGTPEDDLIRIAGSEVSPGMADAFVNASGPAPTFTADPAGLTRWQVRGKERDDRLIVDLARSNPLPSGGLSFDGQSHVAGDALLVEGLADSDDIAVAGQRITVQTIVGGLPFTYAPMDFVNTEFLGFNAGVLSTGLSGDVGLIKTGDGVLTLSAPSTYGRGMTVEAGTVDVTTADALPTGGAIDIRAGATLVLAAGLCGTAVNAVAPASSVARTSAGAAAIVVPALLAVVPPDFGAGLPTPPKAPTEGLLAAPDASRAGRVRETCDRAMGLGQRLAPTAGPAPVRAATHDAVLCARGTEPNTATARWAGLGGLLESVAWDRLRKKPILAENVVDQALVWLAGLDK